MTRCLFGRNDKTGSGFLALLGMTKFLFAGMTMSFLELFGEERVAGDVPGEVMDCAGGGEDYGAAGGEG